MENDDRMGEDELVHERNNDPIYFVRPVKGKYDGIFRQLYGQTRVISTRKMKYRGGPACFGKMVISPSVTDIPFVTQCLESHIMVMSPGNHDHKHGHMNGACMYVLEGKGYDIHDGKRIDWEAGDLFIVKNACVHAHYNASPDRPARVLVIKSKPLFLFFNMLHQKTVIPQPDKGAPGYEDWVPPDQIKESLAFKPPSPPASAPQREYW